MKNKKLFGKLNIIDIFILLVLVAAIVFAALYFLRPHEVVEDAESGASNVRFSLLCEDISPEIAENIITALESEPRTVGDTTISPRRIFNSNQLLSAEVTDWELVQREDDTTDLIVTVEGNMSVTDTVISLGAQELRIGISYNLKTTDIEIAGKVLSVEKLS